MSSLILSSSPLSNVARVLIGNSIDIVWDITDCSGTPITYNGMYVVIEGNVNSLQKNINSSSGKLTATITAEDSYALGCGVFSLRYSDDESEYRYDRAFIITDNPDEVVC